MSKVICPYCKSHALLVDSKVIYGKSYGNLWLCEPCKAYVGCVRGTDTPLGIPANARTRAERQVAHKWLDMIWKNKERGFSRSSVYLWLAGKMNMTSQECHIARFGYDQCREALTHIRTHPYYSEKTRNAGTPSPRR